MTALPTVGVLALQGDVPEHLSALARAGARAVRVRRASELTQIDGLVLPGGESTAITRLLHAFDLADPLRELVADGLPVYGSCAGMILLADRVADRPEQWTLGGLDVTVRRNAFGRQVDSFETDLDAPELTGEGGTLRAVFIRAPWIEEAGPQVEVLARVSGPGATGRIVAVQQGPLLATAFHPEVGGDSRVHDRFLGLVRASQ